MEKDLKLYHGTNVKFEVGDKLKVYKTNTWKNEKERTNMICATDDIGWAKQFAFKKAVYSSGFCGNKKHMIVFNFEITDEYMYIYKLNSDGFEQTSDVEYVSREDVEIEEVVEVLNPLEYFKNSDFELYLSKVNFSKICEIEKDFDFKKESRHEFWNKNIEYLTEINEDYIENKLKEKEVNLINKKIKEGNGR